MYKKITLSMSSCLVVGLFVTGCSQQPVNLAAPSAALADIQPAAMVKPTPIDAQVQQVVTPQPPKTYYQPRPQKMHKPIQRMAKPVQKQVMMKPVQRHLMMSKPIQRQY